MNELTRVAPRRRSLTAEHLEPWTGNVVDLTMRDGSHRIGLLERIDRASAYLRAVAGVLPPPDGGAIRIADTFIVSRASRN